LSKLKIKEKIKYFSETSISILQDIILRQIDNRYTVFNDLINIYDTDEELSCVYLKPERKRPLFCVSIATDSNLNKKLEILPNLVQNHGFKDEAKVIVFYSKSKMLLDEIHTDFCTKQNVYLFTSLREIAEDVSYFYDTEILSVNQIFDALFDIGLVNRYWNNKKNFDVRSTFDIGTIASDDMNYGFRTIFSEGVYHTLSRDNDVLTPKYTLYQGVGSNSVFTGDKPHIKALMRDSWTGYVAFVFDFSTKRVKGYINDLRRQTKNFEKNKEIRDAYKWLKEEKLESGDVSDYLITNVVALIDNPKAINRISSALNVTFMEKSLFRKNIIYGTPITQRDTSCDGLSLVSDSLNYIQSIHKKHNMASPRSRDVYGVDVTGNYISYSFSETGESPHWSMVAPTRSGKSFFIQALISQSIDAVIVPKTEIEMEELFNDKTALVKPREKIVSCSRLGERKVVQFDIGYSTLKFASELHRRYPSDVILFKDDLNNLRFGLTDIRFDYETNQINQEDINFSLSIISLILEVNGEPLLTAQEKGEIIEALTRIFIEDKYVGRELIKLEEFGGYQDVLAKLKASLGEKYDSYARTTDLNLRGTELDFLQKPLIFDILKELGNKANNVMTKSNDRITCENAMSKLKVVSKSEIFSLYSKSNIADSNYFYMELEVIKGLGESVFLPIFLTIFQKLYRRDVIRAQYLKGIGKEAPKIYYIIEEAHNFMHLQSLRKLFEVLLRESARYGIMLGFITQNPTDIPQDLLGNIGTRIIMPSNSITGSQLVEYYWKGHKESGDFFDKFSEKYFAFMNYGKGVITIKPPVTKDAESLFNSNPTEIKKALDAVLETIKA